MANEKPNDPQKKDDLRIDDLTPSEYSEYAGTDEGVKGGMRPRPGGGAFSDPDSGEEIDLLP